MPNPSYETVQAPFTAFNFRVELSVENSQVHLCEASFAECDGLEMTLDVKTIREGGNNGQQIRLFGPVSYGQLTLKRGMTPNYDLWLWFEAVVAAPKTKRAQGEVTLLAADGSTPRARFFLDRCLPVKLKAPALNAKDGVVAIEELQLAYQSLTLVPLRGGP
ncbi:phage tail protein [Archangium violaceum]|uniref:Phage tail protein n=1 Tax=Archangium violaceum Cb vi76 TaxID=1406225 RepID=A0A084T0U8_9BACT|nr:phage tail protein [Archangium violaceum]KFA94333.1 phage tail protein [Archangium violaceum Cb vi76]